MKAKSLYIHPPSGVRVTINTLIVNALLSVFKLFAGLAAQSAAMISDAVHSFSDIFSTIIVLVGIRMARRKADKDHPYGHERMECVTAILLAAILCATGVYIGSQGINKVSNSLTAPVVIPGVLALIAAILSIIIKELMYWYTRSAAKKIDSPALMASAWHHRSDSLSSIGSFIGILGARLGYPIMDSVACIIICLFILKAACDIFLDAIGKMTDRACSDNVVEQMKNIILSQKDVLCIDQLTTRLFGNRIYIDVEVGADDTISLNASHQIAHKVHDVIENAFPKVKHCMVHINPVSRDKT